MSKDSICNCYSSGIFLDFRSIEIHFQILLYNSKPKIFCKYTNPWTGNIYRCDLWSVLCSDGRPMLFVVHREMGLRSAFSCCTLHTQCFILPNFYTLEIYKIGTMPLLGEAQTALIIQFVSDCISCLIHKAALLNVITPVIFAASEISKELLIR